MAISIFDIISFVKELVSDEEKMGKFKEIVEDIKELISDIRAVIELMKK